MYDALYHERRKRMNYFPKIGMRMVKTAMAVAVCFLVYILGGERGAPVFAAIAAVICMQPQMENSVTVAFNRIAGTIAGAFFALVILYLLRYLPAELRLLRYPVISIAVIPVMYIMVMFHRTGAAALAAIVFLSTCLSRDGSPPEINALQRSYETIIGILVSLGVNSLHIPRRKNTEYLFVSGFDGALYHEKTKISPYCIFELNQLLKDGVAFTLATERTPASLLADVGALDLKLPVVAMDGAVLYDLKEKRYLACCGLERCTVDMICGFLKGRGFHYFLNVIWQNVLLIYHQDFKNDVERELYEEARRSPYRNYVYGDVPDEGIVVYILLVVRDAEADMLEREIGLLDTKGELLFLRDKTETPEDYCHLKIYHKNATKEYMVRHLMKDLPQKKTVVFGSNQNDLSMMSAADLSFAAPNATKQALERADRRLKGREGDSIVRKILALYEPLFWQKEPEELRENGKEKE